MRRLETPDLHRKQEQEADQQHQQGNQTSTLARCKHSADSLAILPPGTGAELGKEHNFRQKEEL